MTKCKYLHFKESMYPPWGKVNALHKIELLSMGASGFHSLCPLAPTLYHLCPLRPVHNHSYPSHLLLLFVPTCIHYHPLCLLVPFTIDATFVLSWKQRVAMLQLKLHTIINIMIQLWMILLATFTTGFVFIKWSKQGVTTLAQNAYLCLNVPLCIQVACRHDGQ